MTAEIVHLNADVTRQKTLLESFEAAAAMLDDFDMKAYCGQPEYKKYDQISALSKEIADQVNVPDSYKQEFENAACLSIIRMLSNLCLINQDDKKQTQEIIDYQKIELIDRYKNIAVRENLLPVMFRTRFG
ncbi:MAG TPA: hypothetical protein PLF01_07275 [Alphaproteobacteria bacterium]|nr:hypothetical protein [Alphaproteobacteria bacterium]